MNLWKGKHVSAHKWIPKKKKKNWTSSNKNQFTEKDMWKEIHRWIKYSQCIYLRNKMPQSIEKTKSSLKFYAKGM